MPLSREERAGLTARTAGIAATLIGAIAAPVKSDVQAPAERPDDVTPNVAQIGPFDALPPTPDRPTSTARTEPVTGTTGRRRRSVAARPQGEGMKISPPPVHGVRLSPGAPVDGPVPIPPERELLYPVRIVAPVSNAIERRLFELAFEHGRRREKSPFARDALDRFLDALDNLRSRDADAYRAFVADTLVRKRWVNDRRLPFQFSRDQERRVDELVFRHQIDRSSVVRAALEVEYGEIVLP